MPARIATDKSTARIPTGTYSKIVERVPILCVDLVLEREGKYLLVKRRRAPAKGRWWVPGGRVLKDERLSDAAERKAAEELGIGIAVSGILGFYEHFHRRGHRAGKHTVSMVVLARPKSLKVTLDSQSSAWKLSGSLPNDFKITRFAP